MSEKILYIFKQKEMMCSRPTLHKRLHGQREVRVSITEFGEAIHKTYEYPGVPHQDLAPGVICVNNSKDAARVEEVFTRFKVPFIRARPIKPSSQK